MVEMVENDSRMKLVTHLKMHGPSTILQLRETLGLSENAIRHHLHALDEEGFLEVSSAPNERGRPGKLYSLHESADRVFPQMADELLKLALLSVSELGVKQQVLQLMVDQLSQEFKGSALDPEGRVHELAEKFDYGGMLTRTTEHPAAWEMQAFHCHFRKLSQEFPDMCEIPRRVIEGVTGLPCERPVCQRTGERSCVFLISKTL